MFLVQTGPAQLAPTCSFPHTAFGVKVILGVREVSGAPQGASSQVVQIKDLIWECHYSLLALIAEFPHENEVFREKIRIG